MYVLGLEQMHFFVYLGQGKNYSILIEIKKNQDMLDEMISNVSAKLEALSEKKWSFSVPVDVAEIFDIVS